MKFLAMILLPVLGFAQMKNDAVETAPVKDRRPSSVHLLDKTKSPAKRNVAKAPDYAQYCLDIAGVHKDTTFRYDEALMDCVTDLHKQDAQIGYSNCQKVANNVADNNIKENIKQTCEDHYGYEGCKLSGQKTTLDCLKLHASSLSTADCNQELVKSKLTKDKGAVSLCRDGSIVQKDGALPVKTSLGRGRGSSQ